MNTTVNTIKRKEERTQELLCRIMQNNADEAIAILESGEYDKDVLDDVEGFSHALPLYQLSVCQKILLDIGDWVEDYIPVIDRNKKGCDKLLTYWKELFNYPVDTPVDFSLYDENLGHLSDTPIEDLLDGSIDQLVSMGYDKDEVLLCHAVLTHNSPVISEQIRKGTNPDVWISARVEPGKGTADNGACLNALDFCDDIVEENLNGDETGMFWEDGESLFGVSTFDLNNLLEGAAYDRLAAELKTLVP